jgi:hypothetical protein
MAMAARFVVPVARQELQPQLCLQQLYLLLNRHFLLHHLHLYLHHLDHATRNAQPVPTVKDQFRDSTFDRKGMQLNAIKQWQLLQLKNGGDACRFPRKKSPGPA